MQLKSLFIGAMFLPAVAFASPSDSSVAKLAELVPYEALFFESVIAPIEDERQMLAYGLANDKDINDDQRKKAITAFDDYAQNLVKTLDTAATKKELKDAYIKSAKTHYTQAEVDAQIAFYGSEAGKSALQKSQKVLGDYMKAVAPKGLAKIEEYQKKNLTPMQDNIKRILNK